MLIVITTTVGLEALEIVCSLEVGVHCSYRLTHINGASSAVIRDILIIVQMFSVCFFRTFS